MRTALVMAMLAWWWTPCFGQEADYQSTLETIKTDIESGDYAGALDGTNQLRDYLRARLEAGDGTPRTVEAADLFADFSANEQKAKKTYGVGTWIIHGKVTKIGSTYDDHFNTVPSVEMSVDDYGFKGVTFEFTDDDADQLSGLSVGDDIKIAGTVDKFEMSLTVKVKNCKIVQ
jgi:hypothetical protein